MSLLRLLEEAVRGPTSAGRNQAVVEIVELVEAYYASIAGRTTRRAQETREVADSVTHRLIRDFRRDERPDPKSWQIHMRLLVRRALGGRLRHRNAARRGAGRLDLRVGQDAACGEIEPEAADPTASERFRLRELESRIDEVLGPTDAAFFRKSRALREARASWSEIADELRQSSGEVARVRYRRLRARLQDILGD